MKKYFCNILLPIIFILAFHHVSAQKQIPLSEGNNLPDTITVGMAGNAPFMVDTALRSGISIEIWDDLAGDLQIPFKTVFFEDVPHALAALEQGKVQAAAGPISITAERAEKVRFTQPYFQSSLSIMSITDHPSLIDRILPFFSAKFFIALCIFLCILGIVGTFLWLAERKENPEQFPAKPAYGIANGMWCAIVTMTTTGYGDLAPRTFWGRFTAGAWMVVSLIFATSMIAGFASVLTLSGIHTTSIQTAEQLSGKKVAAVASSPAEDFVRENGGRIVSIENISQGYQLMKQKKVDAMVFDRPQMLYFLKEKGDDEAGVSKAEYQRQGYGFAFPVQKTDMHRINVALLELQESGAVNKISQKWLGEEVK